jgi:hypothetical protein
MKYRHYSPSCKAACVEAHRTVTAQELETSVAELNLNPLQALIGYLSLSPSRLPSSSAKCVRSFGTNSQEQAASLFAGQRELELQQCDLILIECPSAGVARWYWSSGARAPSESYKPGTAALEGLPVILHANASDPPATTQVRPLNLRLIPMQVTCRHWARDLTQPLAGGLTRLQGQFKGDGRQVDHITKGPYMP